MVEAEGEARHRLAFTKQERKSNGVVVCGAVASLRTYAGHNRQNIVKGAPATARELYCVMASATLIVVGC